MSIYGLNRILESNKDERARTPNGVVFKDVKTSAKNTTQSSYDKASNALPHGVATTSFGKDVLDSAMQTRIESFDKEKTKQLLESQDLVKEYNIYIDGKIDEMIGLAEKGLYQEKDGNIVRLIIIGIQQLLAEGFSKSEISDYVKGTYFYTSDNPNNIRLLLNLRLKYCNHITSLLQRMVSSNKALFDLTDKEVKTVLKSIENLDSGTLEAIKADLMQNSDKYYKSRGILDLTSLGGGYVYISLKGKDDITGAVEKAMTKRNGLPSSNENRIFDGLLQKSFRYKAIINVHGGDMPLPWKDDDEDKAKENIKHWLTHKNEAQDFLKLCKGYGITLDDLADYYYKDGSIWFIQDINANGVTCDIVDFALATIYTKSKRKTNTFLLAQCNPGHHRIHPVFNRIPGFKVTYSDFSNYIESGDIVDFDDVDAMINESEEDLRYMAESYGIDYESLDITEEDLEQLNEDCEYLEEALIITEGKFTDALKAFARKIVQTVIGLFKKLWEGVKKAFTTIKDFFKNRKDKGTKLDKPIKTEIITLESAKTKEYSISSQDDLEKAALESIAKIQKEINRVQNIQIKATEELEKLVEKDK